MHRTAGRRAPRTNQRCRGLPPRRKGEKTMQNDIRIENDRFLRTEQVLAVPGICIREETLRGLKHEADENGLGARIEVRSADGGELLASGSVVAGEEAEAL